MAEPKKTRRGVILAKLENPVTPGTDAAPTGAANAILVSNMTVTPIDMQVESRDLVQPELGNSEQNVVATWNKVEFDVEVAGGGAAGTAPKWGVLMKGCGWSENVTAGTDVLYTLANTNMDHVTIYADIDGLLHKLTYGAGNVSWRFQAGTTPKFRFSFEGLYVPVTDGAAITAVYTGFQKPVAFNLANTPIARVHGTDVVMSAFSGDLKTQIVKRDLPNSRSVFISDRKPDGQVTFEATTVAAKNWWASMAAGTAGAFKLQHGATAGNIVEIEATDVQLFQPTYGDDTGILTVQSNLVFARNAAGNPYLTVRVK